MSQSQISLGFSQNDIFCTPLFEVEYTKDIFNLDFKMDFNCILQNVSNLTGNTLICVTLYRQRGFFTCEPPHILGFNNIVEAGSLLFGSLLVCLFCRLRGFQCARDTLAVADMIRRYSKQNVHISTRTRLKGVGVMRKPQCFHSIGQNCKRNVNGFRWNRNSTHVLYTCHFVTTIAFCHTQNYINLSNIYNCISINAELYLYLSGIPLSIFPWYSQSVRATCHKR